jgi:hypothetical protein
VRIFRRTVVVLVLLAGLLVVADRVAAWAAGEEVASRVAHELASNNVESAPPEAEMDGVPFLTQVVSGEYEAVTLSLREVGSGDIRLPELRLVAAGVTAPMSTLVEGSGPIHADRVDGTAVVGYSSIAAQAGLDELELSAAGADDEVAVRVPVELLGVRITLAGTATVSAENNVISVRVTELTAEELPEGSASEVERLVQQLSFDIRLRELPYGLMVESVRPVSAGLEVAFSAVDVPLSR